MEAATLTVLAEELPEEFRKYDLPQDWKDMRKKQADADRALRKAARAAATSQPAQ
jgi:hypothetical protein